MIPNVYDAAAVPTATRERKRKAVVTEEKTIEETLMELNEDDEDDKDFDLNDNKVRIAKASSHHHHLSVLSVSPNTTQTHPLSSFMCVSLPSRPSTASQWSWTLGSVPHGDLLSFPFSSCPVNAPLAKISPQPIPPFPSLSIASFFTNTNGPVIFFFASPTNALPLFPCLFHLALYPRPHDVHCHQQQNKLPKSDTVITVLLQALKTGDEELLGSCVSVTDERVIHSTVRLLPTRLVLQFLTLIIEKFQLHPKEAPQLIPWIKAVLEVHTASVTLWSIFEGERTSASSDRKKTTRRKDGKRKKKKENQTPFVLLWSFWMLLLPLALILTLWPIFSFSSSFSSPSHLPLSSLSFPCCTSNTTSSSSLNVFRVAC